MNNKKLINDCSYREMHVLFFCILKIIRIFAANGIDYIDDSVDCTYLAPVVKEIESEIAALNEVDMEEKPPSTLINKLNIVINAFRYEIVEIVSNRIIDSTITSQIGVKIINDIIELFDIDVERIGTSEMSREEVDNEVTIKTLSVMEAVVLLSGLQGYMSTFCMDSMILTTDPNGHYELLRRIDLLSVDDISNGKLTSDSSVNDGMMMSFKGVLACIVPDIRKAMVALINEEELTMSRWLLFIADVKVNQCPEMGKANLISKIP